MMDMESDRYSPKLRERAIRSLEEHRNDYSLCAQGHILAWPCDRNLSNWGLGNSEQAFPSDSHRGVSKSNIGVFKFHGFDGLRISVVTLLHPDLKSNAIKE